MKKEYAEKYQRHVDWIRRNIAPDDIYDFAQQSLMASIYLLKVLDDEDILIRCLENKITLKWCQNIISVAVKQDEDEDCPVNLKLDELYEDD